METLVKQTRELGTSAGVLLPRSWLNKQVVVTLFYPSLKDISKTVFQILTDRGFNEDIKGICLYGSYARGEFDSGSDIDVLVLTKSLSKFIKVDNYEILLITEENFSRNLLKSLHYAAALREAKVILNRELIEKYASSKIKFNFKENLNEIGRIIKINKESVEDYLENGQAVPDGIVYSVVLRLRELYLIKSILKNKDYNKKEFLNFVGEEDYVAYLRIKREESELDKNSPDKILKLIELSKKWLKELKG